MRRSRITLATLALATFCGISRAQTSPKLPFTISKETTAITSPLNPDGTVDYITAINQRWGKDVKPEENALVGWLEAVGTDDLILSSRTKNKIIAMCGAKDVGPIEWQGYDGSHNPKDIDTQTYDTRSADLNAAAIKLWSAKDFPLLAEYITQNAAFLKQLSDAFSRPKYWLPFVPGDNRSLASVLLPSIGEMRSMSKTLCADATRRAAAGDFPGFLSEIRSVKNFAHHLSSQPTLFENLVGVAINNLADQTIGAVAGSGKLSAQEAASLADMLRLLPPMQEITVSVDVFERWSFLDTIAQMAQGEPDTVARDAPAAPYVMLDVEAIDWNTIMKRVNAAYDAQLDALRQPTFAAIAEKMKLLSAQVPPHKKSSLSQQADESPQAYTTRVGDSLIADFLPSFNNTEQLYLASPHVRSDDRRNGCRRPLSRRKRKMARPAYGSAPRLPSENPHRCVVILRNRPRQMHSRPRHRPSLLRGSQSPRRRRRQRPRTETGRHRDRPCIKSVTIHFEPQRVIHDCHDIHRTLSSILYRPQISLLRPRYREPKLIFSSPNLPGVNTDIKYLPQRVLSAGPVCRLTGKFQIQDLQHLSVQGDRQLFRRRRGQSHCQSCFPRFVPLTESNTTDQ